MKVFVTGANGFVGSYLVRELVERGHKVLAGVRQLSIKFPEGVTTVTFHLEQEEKMKRVLRQTKPEVIFHLAGQSNVANAWSSPSETLMVNAIGTVNLIKAAYETVPQARIFTVGSSEEYGIAAKGAERLDEQAECKPQNPYATSKFIAGQLGMQLAKKYGMNIIHLRPFNHFGPRQSRGFVISDFSSRIAQIEAGLKEPVISVGNLEAWRDFTDVRDIVRAYALLVEKDGLESGIFNICSGYPRKIGDILQQLIELSSMSIEVIIDPDKYRLNDVERFAGNNKRIQETVGWTPKYDFEESLHDTLDWRRGMQMKQLSKNK